jgi:hypothetical protein
MNLENLADSIPSSKTQSATGYDDDYDLFQDVKERAVESALYKNQRNLGRFEIKPDTRQRIIFLNEELKANSGIVNVREHLVWDDNNGKRLPHYVTCVEHNERLSQGNTIPCPLCEGGSNAYLAMMFSVLYENTYQDKTSGDFITKWQKGIFALRIYHENHKSLGKYFENFKTDLLKRIEKNKGRLRGIGVSIKRVGEQSPKSGIIDNWDSDQDIITQYYTEDELIEKYGQSAYTSANGKKYDANYNLKPFSADYFAPDMDNVGVWEGFKEENTYTKKSKK